MSDTREKDSQASAGAKHAQGYAVSWSLNGMIYLIFLGVPVSVAAFRVNPMNGIWEVRLSDDLERIIIDYGDGVSAVLSSVPIHGGRRIPLPVIEPAWGALPVKTRNIAEFISCNFSAYWRLDIPPSARLRSGDDYSTFKLPPRMPAGFNWNAWARNVGERRFLAAPRRRTASPLDLIGGFPCNVEKEDLKRGGRPKHRG